MRTNIALTNLFTGFTMRRSTRGIIAMNIALSISYNASSGLTCALLLGCSDIQEAFVSEQIKAYSALASHPLLLPILLTTYQLRLLRRETKRLWRRLLKVETESKQTGAPVINSRFHPKKRIDYDSITKDVLGVIQLTVSWESYTQALLLGIESIQESISYIDAKTSYPAAGILAERLIFLFHESKIMLWDFQLIDKRGQAQMIAVSLSSQLLNRS
jgi:hypothetical protein